MAKPDPRVQDIPIPQPPSRFGDPESLQYGLTDIYNAATQMALFERQARGALIAQRELADLTAVSTLALTVSAGYVQAEVQSIVTKLNDVIAKQAEIIAAIAALKDAATNNILSLTSDPDEE